MLLIEIVIYVWAFFDSSGIKVAMSSVVFTGFKIQSSMLSSRSPPFQRFDKKWRLVKKIILNSNNWDNNIIWHGILDTWGLFPLVSFLWKIQFIFRLRLAYKIILINLTKAGINLKVLYWMWCVKNNTGYRMAKNNVFSSRSRTLMWTSPYLALSYCPQHAYRKLSSHRLLIECHNKILLKNSEQKYVENNVWTC